MGDQERVVKREPLTCECECRFVRVYTCRRFSACGERLPIPLVTVGWKKKGSSLGAGRASRYHVITMYCIGGFAFLTKCEISPNKLFCNVLKRLKRQLDKQFVSILFKYFHWGYTVNYVSFGKNFQSSLFVLALYVYFY